MDSVVLLSGGMDSCTVLAKVLDEKLDPLCVMFAYGSKHNTTELESAKKIAQYYNRAYRIIEVPQIFEGSALIDQELPHDRTQEEMEAGGIAPSYVPMRNTVLLGLAGAIADSHEINSVWYGAHADDHVGYPDCRPEWIFAMMTAMYLGSKTGVVLQAPFMWMTKTEIVTSASRRLAPLHLTHSCYEGEQPACGTCDTCVNRITAFKEAGFADPIKYDPDVEIKWTEPIQPFPKIDRD